MDSYNSGLVANSMGANAQGICEKYMKHVISEYKTLQTGEEARIQESILRTHSLHRLIRYMKDSMGIEFSQETRNKMKIIDGFYFTCRYPGDDSIEIDKESLDDCAKAISSCRGEIIKIIQEYEEGSLKST